MSTVALETKPSSEETFLHGREVGEASCVIVLSPFPEWWCGGGSSSLSLPFSPAGLPCSEGMHRLVLSLEIGLSVGLVLFLFLSVFTWIESHYVTLVNP